MWQALGGGIHEEDYGSRTIRLGVIMGTGPLSGLRGGVGGGFAGDTPPIPTQDGRGTQW